MTLRNSLVRLDAMNAADIETVAQLGKIIWHTHYSSIISPKQIEYMLSNRYSPENLRFYLNSGDRWLVLLRIDERAVGYFSYALTGRKDEMKVEQLYLLQEFQGRGLGSLMLRYVENEAHLRNISSLVLQVNKQNVSAIAFYRKAGFIVRNEAIFDIGNGFVMDDYVMNKTFQD